MEVPRVSKKKTRSEEWEVLKTEFGRMFRPQLRNLGELFSLRRVYDIEDYQLGTLFGSFDFNCSGVHFLDVLAVTNCGRRRLPYLLMQCSHSSSTSSVFCPQSYTEATSPTA
ncbi:hypothetical protein TRIUR3_34974 [Triticum urartu]|uniref:Uncharacterized protein n=2 Tax=Triticum TaxID=4564 RepID=A0A9R0TVF7_TRITD|nr:hypothetical protein TRIUR3_34974 [Triticum urartu]VAI19195.1 unnamed protein product [Triticum turgidum subsp. durum]